MPRNKRLDQTASGNHLHFEMEAVHPILTTVNKTKPIKQQRYCKVFHVWLTGKSLPLFVLPRRRRDQPLPKIHIFATPHERHVQTLSNARTTESAATTSRISAIGPFRDRNVRTLPETVSHQKFISACPHPAKASIIGTDWCSALDTQTRRLAVASNQDHCKNDGDSPAHSGASAYLSRTRNATSALAEQELENILRASQLRPDRNGSSGVSKSRDSLK